MTATINNKSRIIALDPSGTSTTGMFLYENWSNYKISSFTNEKWLEQAKNLANLLKKEEVSIIACEVGNMWQKQRHNYHFDNLIKLVGLIEYLAEKNQVEYVPVNNKHRGIWESKAKEGAIEGLTCQLVQGVKGRPKQTWTFKGQVLNEHEKDAVLIFYIYWVKFQKKDWPFSN